MTSAPLQALSQARVDPGARRYQDARIAHWDAVARARSEPSAFGEAYHQRLREVYGFLVPPGQRVLEIGSGDGSLMAALEPSYGVGVDFSHEAVAAAAHRYPHLRFVQADAHQLPLDEPFDTVIMSDVLNDLWDVQTVFEQLARLAVPSTRVIVNTYSRLWEPALAAAGAIGLARPRLRQNWLTVEDVANLLDLAGFEVIRDWQEVLWPSPTPLVNPLANRLFVKLWPLRFLALTNFIVARPRAANRPLVDEPSVSVIVPARNEAGNIPEVFRRTPRMGRWTELVFVEGHSRDQTYEAIEQAIAAHPEWSSQLHRQTGTGKGDAVRLGFSKASGDILMILDADLTMPPEDLPRFYDVLRSGKADFANGVRLVYPMEQQAMRLLNFFGNKFFSLAFPWLLGQSVKDTLCGTKALWKADYDRIAVNRAYFGDFDPFGDFDLLFGAAKLNLKIQDVPIRYRDRTYGAPNIDRWRHGALLLQMTLAAARRLKFV
ncbi:MAG TPA: glycosyltransferase [Chloroflexota bacterium]